MHDTDSTFKISTDVWSGIHDMNSAFEISTDVDRACLIQIQHSMFFSGYDKGIYNTNSVFEISSDILSHARYRFNISSARNLGAIFDSNLSFSDHISKSCLLSSLTFVICDVCVVLQITPQPPPLQLLSFTLNNTSSNSFFPQHQQSTTQSASTHS